MFHLGGSDSLGELSGERYKHDRDGLAYQRRPTENDSAFGMRNKGGLKTNVTSRDAGRKVSSDSGSTSEEYILQDMSGVDKRQELHGIQVSRSVHQTIA